MARSVQHSTFKNFLSAIKHYHSCHGYELNLSAFLRLQLIGGGIKRSQGVNSKTRRQITLHILNLFYHLVNIKYTTNKDSLMVSAAVTLAFFGFLRIAELTSDSHSILNVTLQFSTWCSCLSLHLNIFWSDERFPKQIPFGKGHTIVIERANSHLCPLSSILA